MRRVVAVALLHCLLWSCSEPAAPAPEKLRADGLTELQWQVERALRRSNCDWSVDVEHCLDVRTGSSFWGVDFANSTALHGAFVAGTVRLRPAAASAWLAEVEALPVDVDTYASAKAAQIWEGTLPDGAACSSEAECISQLCDNTTLASCGVCVPVPDRAVPCPVIQDAETGATKPDCPGGTVCHADRCVRWYELPEGASCAFEGVCAWPNVCRAGHCGPGAASGEDCLHTPCAPGLQCLEYSPDVWQCGTGLPIGTPCTVASGDGPLIWWDATRSTPACGPSLLCVPAADAAAATGQGTCQPRRHAGEPCVTSAECGQMDGWCNHGVCALLPAPGEPCAPTPPGVEWWTNSCEGLRGCDANQMCPVPSGLGEPCEWELDCAMPGRRCWQGTCQPLGAEGEPCDVKAWDCALGLVCTTVNGGTCQRFSALTCPVRF